MIEARDAKHAYIYHANASKVRGNTTYITHALGFDAADSDDEAYGRAMRMAQARFPATDGWRDHYVLTQRISGIDTVGRIDFSTIIPAEWPSPRSPTYGRIGALTERTA